MKVLWIRLVVALVRAEVPLWAARVARHLMCTGARNGRKVQPCWEGTPEPGQLQGASTVDNQRCDPSRVTAGRPDPLALPPPLHWCRRGPGGAFASAMQRRWQPPGSWQTTPAQGWRANGFGLGFAWGRILEFCANPLTQLQRHCLRWSKQALCHGRYCLTSSTRRFLARPASESLLATGASDDTP